MMANHDPADLQARTVTVEGRPISFARPADFTDPRTGRRRRVTPRRYQDWKTDAARRISLLPGRRPLTGPLVAEIEVGPDRITLDVRQAILDTRPRGVTGDLDNYEKAILDAAQAANLIGDDKQIIAVTARFVADPLEDR